MSAVLLSVKPAFARRLLSGHKTAEVRRRFPSVLPGIDVYVYASTPERAVVGVLRLSAVHRDSPEALWERFATQLDITKSYFSEYVEDREAAVVVELCRKETWLRRVTLEELRAEVGVQPPQSFRYLDAAQVHQLRAIALGGDILATANPVD